MKVAAASGINPTIERTFSGTELREVLQQRLGLFQIRWLLPRELDRDLRHVLAVEGHPRRAVGLVDVPAGRQWRTAVEHPDVVKAQESALEDVPVVGVLRLSHQVKFRVSFIKAFSRKARSPLPVAALSIS